MTRVRTTNNREVGFAYHPSAMEQNVLMAAGKNAVDAGEEQRYVVTGEGVDLPDPVAVYALNLYSGQMESVGNEAREAGVAELESLLGVEGQVATTTSAVANVDISGEDTPAPLAVAYCQVADCGLGFYAKTEAAVKGKLTRHAKSTHGA